MEEVQARKLAMQNATARRSVEWLQSTLTVVSRGVGWCLDSTSSAHHYAPPPSAPEKIPPKEYSRNNSLPGRTLPTPKEQP